MAIFCTKCGTSNEDGAAFCDNCGAPLRPVPAKIPNVAGANQHPTAAAGPVAPSPVININPKKFIYAAAGLASLLIVGGGAAYFVLQPPAATASTLLAAAKAGYGKETTDVIKRELCNSGIDYSKRTFNAGVSDQRTQDWMNLLVTAGLYSPPVEVSSGGLFVQTLLQYVATPELEKYRQGSELCSAKDVEFTAVTDIGKPKEKFQGFDGGLPKVLTIDGKLNLKSVDLAPWMEKPEVREAFLSNMRGWEYKDKALQKQVGDSFGLKDNKWTTGAAYKQELEKQHKTAQRDVQRSDNSNNSATAKSINGGFFDKLAGMFTFGNPLKGTWRTAAQDTGFGGKISAGMGPDLTFTSDTMESMGTSTKVDFSVDGKRVKVTPQGQSQSLIFVMQDQDTMLAEVLGMRYERVK